MKKKTAPASGVSTRKAAQDDKARARAAKLRELLTEVKGGRFDASSVCTCATLCGVG